MSHAPVNAFIQPPGNATSSISDCASANSNDTGTSGGSKISSDNTLCTREDAAYFLAAAGINIDTMLQQALLSNLPAGTQLDTHTEPIYHPNIDWRATRLSGVYFLRPDPAEFAVHIGRDIAAVVEKSMASAAVKALENYRIDVWESLGDLLLIWAHDYSPSATYAAVAISNNAPNWMRIVDITEAWVSDDRSLAEKIIEDGYVHHLGCNETSPYLTQLETE